MSLASKRCFNHGVREAVAKCLDCGNFFCRECITEHDGRLTCCNCLSQSQDASESAGKLLPTLITVKLSIIGLIVLWLVFFFIATRLLKVEDDAFEQGHHFPATTPAFYQAEHIIDSEDEQFVLAIQKNSSKV